MDFRRFWQAVRRFKYIVVLLLIIGAGAGVAYSVVSPPLFTGTALVVLPNGAKYNIQTQVLVASSDPVLLEAAEKVSPPMTLQLLRLRVQVGNLTPNVVSINGKATTASRAEDLANAVADSYLAYIKAPSSPGGVLPGRILQAATTASGSAMRARIEDGALGAAAGLLIGIVIALSLGRADKRLRHRDDIADAIGIPVLASIPALRPSDASGWTRLLGGYEPSVVDAWSLRKALRYLGLTDARGASGTSVSLTVVTISGDRAALALGPQIAAFGASLGIQTAIVVGQQQGPGTAALAAACGATADGSSGRPFNISLHAGSDRQSGAALTVVVAVVDGQHPQFAGTVRTTATILGVSAGSATAEQLAQVAVSAAGDGREVSGIVVADPDPTDVTTGRLPQAERSGHRRMPNRMTGTTTETT
jgi:capsular polysaccharide biosynthesis protein